jgi:hypothetical protein
VWKEFSFRPQQQVTLYDLDPFSICTVDWEKKINILLPTLMQYSSRIDVDIIHQWLRSGDSFLENSSPILETIAECTRENDLYLTMEGSTVLSLRMTHKSNLQDEMDWVRRYWIDNPSQITGPSSFKVQTARKGVIFPCFPLRSLSWTLGQFYFPCQSNQNLRKSKCYCIS